MKPKHQAIVAGLALSLTLGVAAPVPMFAQTDTAQQQDVVGNADADPIINAGRVIRRQKAAAEAVV